MKKKMFCMVALCLGLFSSSSSCEDVPVPVETDKSIIIDIGGFEEAEMPQPTSGLIKVKIDDDIMAIVGSSTWNCVTKGIGRYVAVGDSGYITSSTDGVNWSNPKQVGTNKWSYVAYGGGKFMVVGIDGYVTSSSDGVNWATPTAPLLNGFPAGNLMYVIYADGKFVAERNGASVVFISSNGSTWDNFGTIFNKSGGQCRGIAYGDGKFIAFGAENSTGAKVCISTDGITWDLNNTIQLYFGPVQDVAYGNGRFVAIGGFYTATSTDGINWDRHVVVDSSHPSLKCITFSDGYFITCGNAGEIYISEDGTAWTKVSNSDTTWINSVCGM